MGIKLKSAKRNSFNSVEVTYSTDEKEFTVEWDNTDGCYELQLATKSACSELAQRVDDAILEGETDENNDLALYLAIRDTFDKRDCIDQEFNCLDDFYAVVSDEQLHANYDIEHDKINYSINYAINDDFMIQYDPASGFTIPASGEAAWSDHAAQDQAALIFDADYLAKHLNLPSNLDDFLKKYPRDFTSKFLYETYCNKETKQKLAAKYSN